MDPNSIFAIFNFFQIGLIVKLFISVLIFFYVVFTIVVYRQISLMTQVLDSKISPLVKTIAFLQIIATLSLFLLALILA